MMVNGYEFQTTFWSDFSIADMFGLNAIQDTFNRAHANWKENVSYYKELTCVLNWKCWAWNEKRDDYMELYRKLYNKASEYGYNHFKGAELREFWEFLD